MKDSYKTESQVPHHLAKGVWLSLLVWLIFTVMNAITKEAHKTTTVPMILLFQNIVGLLFTLPYVIKHHFKTKEYRKSPFALIAIRCISGQMNLLFLLLAVLEISFSNAVLLNNTAPFFIPLISLFFLKVKVDHKIWIGITIGFLGLIFVLKPTSGILSTGAIYAIIAGVSLAVLMTSMRLLAFKEKVMVVSFYNFLFGSLITIPWSLFYWKMDSWITLFQLLIIGALVLVGQVLLLKSFSYAKASQLGPIVYVQVLYAVMINWLIWKQVPDFWTSIGMTLVCFSGVMIILFTRSPKR